MMSYLKNYSCYTNPTISEKCIAEMGQASINWVVHNDIDPVDTRPFRGKSSQSTLPQTFDSPRQYHQREQCLWCIRVFERGLIKAAMWNQIKILVYNNIHHITILKETQVSSFRNEKLLSLHQPRSSTNFWLLSIYMEWKTISIEGRWHRASIEVIIPLPY